MLFRSIVSSSLPARVSTRGNAITKMSAAAVQQQQQHGILQFFRASAVKPHPFNRYSTLAHLSPLSSSSFQSKAFITTTTNTRLGLGLGLGRRQQQHRILLPSHHHHHHQNALSALAVGALRDFSSGRGGGVPPSRDRLLRGAGLLGTSAIVLLGKGKYLLGALKLTKLASLGSMLLTVGTYSMFFGWPYAVGMVGLIVIHETGHALVMLHYKIPFSPMVFVPFVGATVMMNRMPADAWQEAMTALGGPVLGSLGAFAVAVAGHSFDSQLFLALADAGFILNLFNLLPIGFLDGGRIAGAMSPYAHVVGLGLGSALAYEGVIVNPIFYLILLAGAYETFQRFYNPTRMPPNYYRITNAQRTLLAGGYFGLIAALIAATAMNNRERKPPEVLQREKHWDVRYGE